MLLGAHAKGGEDWREITMSNGTFWGQRGRAAKPQVSGNGPGEKYNPYTLLVTNRTYIGREFVPRHQTPITYIPNRVPVHRNSFVSSQQTFIPKKKH